MVQLILFLYLTFGIAVNFGTVFAAISQSPKVPPALQQILDKADKRPWYTFPTSFTQGIKPKYIHSHNDYEQTLPFYNALSVGAVSIETDVWLLNGTLYVGHEPVSLSSTRTFESLYISPILETLKYQNPTRSEVSGSPLSPSQNGVYETNHRQTLYLYVDLKTDDADTFPAVIKALEPLRRNGYLSSTDGHTYKNSAVTVIGTGATPLEPFLQNARRDYFYDLPVTKLSDPNITNLVSRTAYASFSVVFGPLTEVGLNKTQLETLRGHLKLAQSKGIRLRYFNQPEWPLSTRNTIWRQFVTEGVDFVCVDDLEAAAGYGDLW